MRGFFLLLLPCAVLSSPALSWFSASDTHLGHDAGIGANRTTSFTKNVWAVHEMNSLPGSAATWPASLGGGQILPPAGVTVSGDLIDSGIGPATTYNGCAQWENFTALYGLNGTDGLLKYRVYEGRGNHDGAFSKSKPTEPRAQTQQQPVLPHQTGKNSSLTPPRGCAHSPSGWVIARNAARAADPAFNVVGVSQPTGLHYSWTWNISATCAVHFVHLNLFPGRECGSAENPAGEGTPPPGFPCTDGDLAWAENSLGFLEADLAAHGGPGVMTVTIQHYGFDGFSNGWYNADQRVELLATLSKSNPLVLLVGHTHTAEVYSYNGTEMAPWGTKGFVDVINAPATQKEDGKGNPLPSEFMVIEAAMDSPTATTGTLRVAQRVGSGWGTVLAKKSFQC